MHSDHPGLSPEINRNIKESELQGGVWLFDGHTQATVLPIGKSLVIQTENTRYVLDKVGKNEFYIIGHWKFCPVRTRCYPHGSTWGGSILKVGFVGRGMHFEFGTPEHGMVTTSKITEITEV